MMNIFSATSLLHLIKPGQCRNVLPICEYKWNIEIICRTERKSKHIKNLFPGIGIRSYSSNVKTNAETNDASNSTESAKFVDGQTKSHYRFVYPEFLPHPNMEYRHPIKEKIERQDLLKRR